MNRPSYEQNLDTSLHPGCEAFQGVPVHMSSQPTPTSYDALPYPSLCHPQTHPDHLATVATLLGLNPPAPDRCRVLELGCASGGNLIPLAFAAPGSSFLGIDLSAEQVAQGQRTIAALGLNNIDLRHLSILDVDDSFGSFDYVLCPGVFSWVPPPVQEKVLAVCASHLAPEGIGYVSYNTYPGWHMRGLIRDMMTYHVSRSAGEGPLQQVRRARSLLDFLVRAVPAGNSPYGLLLREQLDLLRQHTDSYLFHEHLEEHNEPLYFLQFCERLAPHGLRYLGEAEFRTMLAGASFPQDLRQELDELAPNLIEKEQYLDFVRNRMFRQTLVCHAHRRPCYSVRAERLAAFHVASPARPREGPELRSEAPVEFAGGEGTCLTVSAPFVKAALVCLGEAWPRAVPFADLPAQALARLGRGHDNAEAVRHDTLVLARVLLTAYANAGDNLVQLSLCPPRFTTEVSERPLASPLARLQAESAAQATNLRHELVNLTPFDRHLLPHLDGTRDRPSLLAALLERFRQGQLQIEEDGQPVAEEGRAERILAEVLDQQLPKLAAAALLIA